MAIKAVITNGAMQYWPQFFGGLLGISAGSTTVGAWNPLIRSFKIGRGGWINSGAGPVPRIPDPTLTDLDIVLDYARAPLSRRYSSLAGNIMFVEKGLTLGDFSFEAPNVLVVRDVLDFGDFNDVSGVPSTPPGGPTLAPSGVGPLLYEIGLFSDHPSGTGELMIAYGTVRAESKTPDAQKENDFRLIFG